MNCKKINQRLLDNLKKFKSVWISVSLEGIQEANDSIRHFSDWKTVEHNLFQLESLPNVYFNINHVLQCFSVVTLIPLLLWAEKHKIKISNTLLTHPEYLKINSVDADIVENFRNQLKELQLENNQNVVNQVVELLNGHTFDPELKKQRLEYLSTLDSIRGTELTKLIH